MISHSLFFYIMRYNLILLLFILASDAYSQKENSIWYLGDKYGVDFNYDPPLGLQDGVLPDLCEGISTYSDAEGNLLFYSNGEKIWNSLHRVMPNGQDLKGHRSSTQGVVFVRHPLNTSQVFVITCDWEYSNSIDVASLYYSVIDMSLDAGLGDILPTKKNVLLGHDYAEKLVGIKGLCGDAWIVTQKRHSTEIHSFHLNSQGDISGPYVSDVLEYEILTDTNFYTSVGTIQASPNGDILSFCAFPVGVLKVMRFDKGSGLIISSYNLEVPPTNIYDALEGKIPGDYKYYTSCFSSSGNFLYTFETNANNHNRSILTQYQLYWNADSLTYVKTPIATINGPFVAPYLMQLEMNSGKIYFGHLNNNYLYTIENPDIEGVGCNFQDSVVKVSDGISVRKGNPNIVIIPDLPPPAIDTILPQDPYICTGAALEVALNRFDSVKWSDNDRSLTRTLTAAGDYAIIAYLNGCPYYDTTTVEIHKSSDLIRDTVLCEGSSLVVSAPLEDALWQDSVRAGTYMINRAGEYYVQGIDSQGCETRDSFTVSSFANSMEDVAIYDNCPEDIVHIGSQMITSDRVLYDTLISYSGCDSIIRYDIRFLTGHIPDTLDIVLAAGESYPFYNQELRQAGLYRAYLIDENSCDSIVYARVTIEEIAGSTEYYLPTIFSPNGDGTNDIFKLELSHTSVLQAEELTIYNRWGGVVYHSTTAEWGGNLQDQAAPSDIYIYQIRLRDSEGETHTINGTIALIR